MPAPLDQLLEQARSALHAKRTVRLRPAEAVRARLDGYITALEHAVAADFAKVHGLPRPDAPLQTPEAAARALLEAVRALPELAAELAAQTTRSPEPLSAAVTRVADGTSPTVRGPEPSRPASVTTPVSDSKSSATPTTAASVAALLDPPDAGFRRLLIAVGRHPLVLVGGPPRREKLAHLPSELEAAIEWLDTTGAGTHGIGQLEKRIRDSRVTGVVILEGLVLHRHSDPLVAACRASGVPYALGGKAGRKSLDEALRAIDGMLASSIP